MEKKQAISQSAAFLKKEKLWTQTDVTSKKKFVKKEDVVAAKKGDVASVRMGYVFSVNPVSLTPPAGNVNDVFPKKGNSGVSMNY